MLSTVFHHVVYVHHFLLMGNAWQTIPNNLENRYRVYSFQFSLFLL